VPPSPSLPPHPLASWVNPYVANTQICFRPVGIPVAGGCSQLDYLERWLVFVFREPIW